MNNPRDGAKKLLHCHKRVEHYLASTSKICNLKRGNCSW